MDLDPKTPKIPARSRKKRGQDFASKNALEALTEHEDEEGADQPPSLPTEEESNQLQTSILLGPPPSASKPTLAPLAPPAGLPQAPPLSHTDSKHSANQPSPPLPPPLPPKGSPPENSQPPVHAQVVPPPTITQTPPCPAPPAPSQTGASTDLKLSPPPPPPTPAPATPTAPNSAELQITQPPAPPLPQTKDQPLPTPLPPTGSPPENSKPPAPPPLPTTPSDAPNSSRGKLGELQTILSTPSPPPPPQTKKDVPLAPPLPPNASPPDNSQPPAQSKGIETADAKLPPPPPPTTPAPLASTEKPNKLQAPEPPPNAKEQPLAPPMPPSQQATSIDLKLSPPPPPPTPAPPSAPNLSSNETSSELQRILPPAPPPPQTSERPLAPPLPTGSPPENSKHPAPPPQPTTSPPAPALLPDQEHSAILAPPLPPRGSSSEDLPSSAVSQTTSVENNSSESASPMKTRKKPAPVLTSKSDSLKPPSLEGDEDRYELADFSTVSPRISPGPTPKVGRSQSTYPMAPPLPIPHQEDKAQPPLKAPPLPIPPRDSKAQSLLKPSEDSARELLKSPESKEPDRRKSVSWNLGESLAVHLEDFKNKIEETTTTPDVRPPPAMATVPSPNASTSAVAKESFVQDLHSILADKSMGIALYTRLTSGSASSLNPTPWVLRSILQRASSVGVAIDFDQLEQAWPRDARSNACLGESDFCDRWLPMIVDSVLKALDDNASVALLAPDVPSWLESWAVTSAADDRAQVSQQAPTYQPQDLASTSRSDKQRVFQQTVASMQAMMKDMNALRETGEALCRQYRFQRPTKNQVLEAEESGETIVNAKFKDVSAAVVPATLMQLWHHMQRLGIHLDGNNLEVHWTQELWLLSHPSTSAEGRLSSNEFSIQKLPRIVESIVSSAVHKDGASDGFSNSPPQWLVDWSSQTAKTFREHQLVDKVSDLPRANDFHSTHRSQDKPASFSGTYPQGSNLPPFQTKESCVYPQASLSSTQLPAMMAGISANMSEDRTQGIAQVGLPTSSQKNDLHGTMLPNQVPLSNHADKKMPLGKDIDLGAAATAVGGRQAIDTLQLIKTSRERKQELERTLGLMETWNPRTAADIKSFKEAGDTLRTISKELSGGLRDLQVTLDMTLGMSQAETVFRTKVDEAIVGMMDELESDKNKLAVISQKRPIPGQDSAPLVFGVMGIEEHLAGEFVVEEARRLLSEGIGVQPSEGAAQFLLECTRQLFVRRFNTNLMMWRVMAPGGKLSVGMRDIAHGIYRADRIALPRAVLRAIWIEALKASSLPEADISQREKAERLHRTRRLPDVRCGRGCAVCGITLKNHLEGIELERLDVAGFSRAFTPTVASDNTSQGKKSVGDVAGNHIAPHHDTSWLRAGRDAKDTVRKDSEGNQNKSCDLLACLLDEAQGMDAQTFRRAVWAGLSRECASRINNARTHRKNVLQHMEEVEDKISNGNLQDSSCTMAELLHEWHEIQALRGFFGTIIEYPFKENPLEKEHLDAQAVGKKHLLKQDFVVAQKESLRKVEKVEKVIEQGVVVKEYHDYAEETFAQTVVTNVKLGGRAHKAGVVVGSRVVSVGLQSSTYSVLEGRWRKSGGNEMVHVVAFVSPEHREGGEAMQELLASSRPGNCIEDFARVVRRFCKMPDGKCKFSIRQINAMWESITAHGNHDNLRITRFMAGRSLRRISMPMEPRVLDHIFKRIQEHEKQAAQKDFDRRVSSAFRCVECVTESRRSNDLCTPRDMSNARGRSMQPVLQLANSEPLQPALARKACLSECPRCTICNGWGHTADAPHLVYENRARCHRPLQKPWSAVPGKTPPSWSGLCMGYGHHEFQCPGKYESEEEGTICKLCLGKHSGSKTLLGAHPNFENFLARHGACKACGGIGHWWRACPHGNVDTVNLHEFSRTRAIYLSDVLREVGRL